METIISILVLVVNLGYATAEFCYGRYGIYWGSYYMYYCSGYCSGFGHQYCEYDLQTGAIVGIVIGSLIFLGIVIGIIVAICCSCVKTSGTRGRVVHPVSSTGGVAVVQTGTNYYSAQPTAPPQVYSVATYGLSYPQAVPPPPPPYSAYNTGQQPPPYLPGNTPYPPPTNAAYPPPPNTQNEADDHVQQPPLSTSRNPLSTFSGPNANLRRNN